MKTPQKLAAGTAAIALLGQAILAADTPDVSLIATGKTKFEQTCIACHAYTRSDTMIAPPAFAIQTHYKSTYGADETAFRQAIVDWAKAPEASKSIMPGAIAKFKVMPYLPQADEDLNAIAAYLYSAAFTETCNMQGNGPMRRGPSSQ